MDSDLQVILGAAQANSNTTNDLDTKIDTKSKRKEKEWTQFRNKYHQWPHTQHAFSFMMDPTYNALNVSTVPFLLNDLAYHDTYYHTETRLLDLMQEHMQSEHSGLQLARIKQASKEVDSYIIPYTPPTVTRIHRG